MINVENVEVSGWEAALRGMRNPLASHNKADSFMRNGEIIIGPNDLDLMKRLTKAGPEHRKFLRMIHVQMDLTIPLYFEKQFSTYKVGTVTNSYSTMHTIHKNGIDYDLFSFDGGAELDEQDREVVDRYIHLLEKLRKECKSGDEKWRTLIQLLPSSFNQKRTIDLNYETALTMIRQRRGHKLSEWNEFLDILEALPYMNELVDTMLNKGLTQND